MFCDWQKSFWLMPLSSCSLIICCHCSEESLAKGFKGWVMGFVSCVDDRRQIGSKVAAFEDVVN